MMTHIKKGIIIILMLIIPALGLSYEIELTRQLNKFIAEDNVISIAMNDSGLVTINYPSTMKRAGIYQREASNKSLSKSDQWVSYVVNNRSKTSRSQLTHSFKAAQAFHHFPLFYSSEVDTLTLTIREQKSVLWQISFNNWQELKKFKSYLGEWELMIDTIAELELMAQQVTANDKVEVAQ